MSTCHAADRSAKSQRINHLVIARLQYAGRALPAISQRHCAQPLFTLAAQLLHAGTGLGTRCVQTCVTGRRATHPDGENGLPVCAGFVISLLICTQQQAMPVAIFITPSVFSCHICGACNGSLSVLGLLQSLQVHAFVSVIAWLRAVCGS
jgi:hypothetical protein